MRISRDQVICGVPAFDLRAAFKRLSNGWTPSDLAKLLGMPLGEVESFLSALIDAGYVEPDFEFDGDQRFRLTIQGGALAAATALPPITRQKAKDLVEEVVRRATDINPDRQELYRVVNLWVFGSYLTDAEELADVDIAFELARKDEEWPPIPQGEYAYADATSPPRNYRGSFERWLGLRRRC